jgi:oligosaccharide repeat unit polymerase
LKRRAPTRAAIRVVMFTAVALIVCLPWYWQFLQELGSTAGYSNIWIAIRARIVALSETQWTEPVARWDSVLFSNVVTFAGLIAFVGVVHGGITKRERFFVVLQVLLALLYTLLTASTAGAASLLGGVFAIRSLKNGSMKLRQAMVVLLGFIVVFGTVAMTLGKGRTNPSASAWDNAGPALEVVELYTIGGLVAFDRVVQDPSSIRASWSISRFFLLTANKLGATFEVPSIHAEYTLVSSGMTANVYTIYFSYFRDYGWLGVILLPALLGSVLTVIYLKASQGSPEALVLYGMTFSGIILSGFGEQFFMALNTLIKAGAVGWLVFSFPRHCRSRALGYEPRRVLKTV